MKRLFPGIITAVIIFGVVSLLKRPSLPEIAAPEAEQETFALGKRLPAGRIQHQIKGKLPSAPGKSRPIDNFMPAPARVSEQDPDEREAEPKKINSPGLTEHYPAPSRPQGLSRSSGRSGNDFKSQSSSAGASTSAGNSVINISNAGFSRIPNLNNGATSSSGGTSTPVERPLVITGKVKPLVGQISSVTPWMNPFTAWASTNCTTPKVGIFRTAEFLNLGMAPIKEVVLKSDATFTFYPDQDLDTTRPQDYSLQVLGCDTFFSRIVTAFDDNQHIHLSSTLLSFAQVSPVNISPTEIPNSDFKGLSTYMERNEDSYVTIVDAFEKLNTGFAADRFTDLFNGSKPENLKFSLPIVREVAIPAIFTEGVSAVLTVDAVHWNPYYSLAVEWFINGVSTSFGSAWNWTPPGNSLRTVQITVRIGFKNESQDSVDTSYPYHQVNFTRDMINAIRPTPPELALDSAVPQLINTPHLPLKISTGAELSKCDSFSSLAITETPTSPNPQDFNIICSQEVTQDLLHSLDSANQSDGAKTLYLWAKDDLDEISSTPWVLSFGLDQSPPVLTLPSLNTTYPGNTNFTLTWNVVEENSRATDNYHIEFFNGSSWEALPEVTSLEGALNNQAFSTSFLFPDSDISSARFRLTFTDALGQSGSVTSDSFNIRVPQLVPSPLFHNFGDIPALSPSAPISLTFTNVGEWQTAACNTPLLSGDTADFSLLSENCTASSLGALNGSCTVTVRANPSERAPKNGTLTLGCGTKSASVTLTVTGENNPPQLAGSSSTSLNEDVIHNFTLSSATDVDGDNLTYSIISAPTHGTLSSCLGGTSDLSCTYTPGANYYGTDTFTYQAHDGFNYSSPQTVTLTIVSVNDAPVISTTHNLSGNEDDPIIFQLNEGTDVENDPLTYAVVSAPSHGSVSCTGRNCTYTPNPDYYGSDVLTYKASDGSLDSEIVTLTISLIAVNDLPVTASNFSFTLNEDSPHALNLLAGSDIDLPAQALTYVLVSGPSHGTLTGCIESAPGTDLSCLYTPEDDYFGADSFSYKICDPFVCSSSVTTVSLTINPVNDNPVMIADQNYSLNDTQFIDFTLNGATDIDVPAQSLTYQIVSAPAQGTLTGCIDNGSWSNALNCRFTPPVNFNGNVSFTYRAFDGTGQSVEVSTVTFTISDKTPSPSPDITLASSFYTNQSTVTVTNNSCSDIASLYISSAPTTPDSAAAGWLPCTVALGALSTTISTLNSTHSIYVWSKDQFGNVQSTPDTTAVVFDNVLPAMNVITDSLLGNATGTVKFDVTELHASAVENFNIRYHNGSGWSAWTLPSANGPLEQVIFGANLSVPNLDHGTLIFEVKYKDLAGNESVVQKNIYSDLSAPVVDALSLNGGVIKSKNNNLLVSLTAHDNTSKIRFFCLQYNNSTAPSANSSCWKNVTAPTPGIVPAQNISFDNYYFQIGFIKAIYTIHVWVKDDAGLMSTNTQTLNVDLFNIDYDPGSPPRLLELEVTNSNTPNRPNQPSDLIAGSGDPVFVKWKAEDDEGFAVNPIALEYSLNDVDFMPIVGFQTLQNAANGACSLDDDFTGCAVIPAPSNDYFKIRVIAKDDADTTVYLNSEPINNSRLRILAGNTEHGLGGSAATAVYYPYSSGKEVGHLTKHKLAVSEDGRFFYLDPVRGLLWIDPSTGSLKVFIPKTGSSSGDGGSIASATLSGAQAITMDAYNHLLIWDNDRIRRVNIENMTINAVLGGGAVNEPTGVTAASAFKLGGFNNLWGTIIPLPNGDIIFSPGTGTRNLYRYRSSDQMIEPMILSGQGFDGDSGANWNSYTPLDFAVAYDVANSNISFMTKGFYRSYTGDSYSHYVRILPTGNATTPYPSTAPYDLGFAGHSVTTALDGKVYLVDRFRRRVFLYDPATNIKTPVAGNGVTGSSICPDDILATNCAMDIDSFFVSKNGRIYLTDNGVIRTIDDNKNIITLFGQFPSYGNGQLATVARFGDIVDLKFGKHSAQNDYLVVSDGFSAEYREFKIDGLTTGLGSNEIGWAGPWRFETDPATGDVFAKRGGGLQRLIRATNTWTTVVGGGGTRYISADGLSGSDIYFSSYGGHTSGFVDGKLYYKTHYWTGTQNQGCMIKAYDVNASYQQSHFNGTPTNNCATSYIPGANLSTQHYPTTYITSFIDPSDGIKKIFFAGPNGVINRVGAGNILQEFLTLPRNFPSFSYKFDGDGLNIYYCSDKKLYRYNYNLAQEYELAWPSTTIHCKGATLYNAERNTIIFSFTQNGLDGVAEYRLN